jgi:hypothetical protein
MAFWVSSGESAGVVAGNWFEVICLPGGLLV